MAKKNKKAANQIAQQGRPVQGNAPMGVGGPGPGPVAQNNSAMPASPVSAAPVPTSASASSRSAARPNVRQQQAVGMSQTAARSASAQASAATAANRRGKRTAIIVSVACVVVAIAVWLLVWLFACNGNSLFDPNAQTGQAPYKSAEEMQAELDRVVEEGMFNISIASIIEFADGSSPGTAYIENVPGNPYNMQVTITQDDTGDVLYESGILAPNQFVENIVLARDLDPGTYDATATFKAIDTNTFEEMGQAAAKITINVLG